MRTCWAFSSWRWMQIQPSFWQRVSLRHARPRNEEMTVTHIISTLCKYTELLWAELYFLRTIAWELDNLGPLGFWFYMTSQKRFSRCHVDGLENGRAVQNLSPIYDITSGVLRHGVLPPNENSQSYSCSHPEFCLGRLQVCPQWKRKYKLRISGWSYNHREGMEGIKRWANRMGGASWTILGSAYRFSEEKCKESSRPLWPRSLSDS